MNERTEANTRPDDEPAGAAAFVAAARRVLDAGDGALDAELVARLGTARRAAVATMRPAYAPSFGRWVPAGAAACTFLAVGLLAWSVKVPTLPLYDNDVAQLVAQDLDLLDDIEFVAWMVELDSPDAT